jgi:hypothetical protein
LNNADVSTEYTDTLRKSLMDEVPSALTTMSENEQVKLESCLSGLGSVAASLKAVIDYGMQQLRVSAIKPRVNPWVDAFLSVSHQLSEASLSIFKRITCYCSFQNLPVFPKNLKKSFENVAKFKYMEMTVRYQNDDEIKSRLYFRNAYNHSVLNLFLFLSSYKPRY